MSIIIIDEVEKENKALKKKLSANKRKEKKNVRIFSSIGRGILYTGNRRVKVKSIFLLEEILTDFESKQSSNAT